MKNKSKPDQGSYANMYKQKLTETNQNKTSILMDKEKKGINFDDLNDWMEIKYEKNDDSNFQKEYQNNNIQSKQNLNIYGLLPQSNSNHNLNINNAYDKKNENVFKGSENKEDLNPNGNRNSIYQNKNNNTHNNHFGVDLNLNLNKNYDYNANSNTNNNPVGNHIDEYSNRNFNMNNVDDKHLEKNYNLNLQNNQNPNNQINVNYDANNNIKNIFNNKINVNNFDEGSKQISNLNNINFHNQIQNNVNSKQLSEGSIKNFQNIYNHNVQKNNGINSKYNVNDESEKNINNNFENNNNNLNFHNRKNSKEDYFPNYPIRENDEFSINTSNFTNRWDLGNYGEKMDMSNLQNNNLAFKNQNIMINFTKDNVDDLTAGNNTVENPPELLNNRGNEAYFSSSIKNQMANLTNKMNNIGNNRNNINQLANQIHPIMENESLDGELTNNKLEDDLRNQYIKSNNNFNNNTNHQHQNHQNQTDNNQFGNIKDNNYKEFYNKEKLNSVKNLNQFDALNTNLNEDLIVKKQMLPNNLNIQKAMNINSNEHNNLNDFNSQNINNQMNNKNNKIKANLNKENSDDESGNESSGFKNEIDNDMNITQNQLNDLKKEIYEINKQTKKQNSEADNKNKINSNKLKTFKGQTDNNQNITSNANNTNFSEKTKVTNLSTAKGDLNNNNNINTNNLNQKPKRRPSPYLRNKEPINSEKASGGNVPQHSKSNDAKNILMKNNPNINNDLSAKPISIQTFQQNTNIMHIDPMVNPIPQMIYNMNTYNNNYANGYGNINLAYNHMLPAHGMNLPYNSLLPQMNYMNNMNIPNPIFGGFPSQNQPVMANFNNNIHNLNNNPNNNITNDTTSIQDSYTLNKTKGENAAGYKPYTIKDYKEKINDVKKLEKLPRSLGANIGTKEWEEKAEKNKKAKEYAKNLAAGAANKKLYNPILNERNGKDDSYSKNNNHNSKSASNHKNNGKKDAQENQIQYATEERKPMHVKDFYSNLKGIKEASDNEDSFEEFENKLEKELDNPLNRNSIKKANIKTKNKTEADSLDDIEVDSEDENFPRTKKIQSGKSHIHNLINLKKISSEKNANEIRNINENAVITVDLKNKDSYQEKNRPKSTSKLENIKKNNDKNSNSKPIKIKEGVVSKNVKNNKDSNASSDHNKIYTTLGTDRDIVNRLKPINTSRINSSLNTTRNSRPVSSKNINKNVVRNINIVNAKTNENVNNYNSGKGNKENIDDLLQKHDLYYEKAQKIKNFMSKL